MFIYLVGLLSIDYGTLAWIGRQQFSTRTNRLFSDKGDNLSGETLGDKYLLCEDSKESTSGKSNIYKAYRKCDTSGNPIGDQVVIKVSDNIEALEREHANYDKVNSDLFVDAHEYMEPLADDSDTECKIRSEKGALVLELGTQDLKAYLDENGPLKGDELRDVAWKCVECINNLHEKEMVWTEMKSENFIRQDCGTVKGIDLESAVPHKGNPIDYSPKSCPPEFAVRYLCGSEPSMEMEYNFDIWSLGMTLLELATGAHYFEGEDNILVCKELKNTGGIELDEFDFDAQLKELIGQCLQVDKTLRPTIEQVKNHPYFAS